MRKLIVALVILLGLVLSITVEPTRRVRQNIALAATPTPSITATATPTATPTAIPTPGPTPNLCTAPEYWPQHICPAAAAPTPGLGQALCSNGQLGDGTTQLTWCAATPTPTMTPTPTATPTPTPTPAPQNKIASFATGPLSALPSTSSIYNCFKALATTTWANGEVAFDGATLTCASGPEVDLMDCATSTTCGTPTKRASATITTGSVNTIFDMSIANSGTITAGNYYCFVISTGTCAAVSGGFSGAVQLNQ